MKIKTTFIIALISSISFGQATITSEEIVVFNDSIELPGTLSYTNVNTPLIIWVHGSGNVDRNGNQGTIIKANYIKQFRDSINKSDIAFFSFDKRTSNPKNFKYLKNISFNDLVDDVQKVVSHFKTDKRFSEIILVGHSQGSLIAMLASEGTQKFISIAGPSTGIDKTLIQQITKQAPFLVDALKAHIRELKETGSIKEVNQMLLTLFKKENQTFIADWLKYDPSEEIKKLTIPVLIIGGTKDIQVKVEDATALHESNKKTTLALIDNMNHVLKNIVDDADNMKSYYSADYSLSSELIASVLKFIKK